MNTISPVGHKNNTSFGMAWTPKSKELFANIIEASAQDTFLKGFGKKGLGKVAANIQDMKTNSTIRKIGKMISDQDYRSNAHGLDLDVTAVTNRGKNLIKAEVYNIREGVHTGQSFYFAADADKPGLKNLKKFLEKGNRFVNHLDAKLNAQNARDTVRMHNDIAAAKDIAIAEMRDKVRFATAEASTRHAGSRISRLG